MILPLVFGILFGCTDAGNQSRNLSTSVPQATSHKPPSDCNANTDITGEKLNVLGNEIFIREGPGSQHAKIVNEKATRALGKTHYISIDDTVTVYEECVKGDWSWIRVTTPDWLQDSHRGWVESKNLDKGQVLPGDSTARLVSKGALHPYTREHYPDTFAKYGSRINDIERYRKKAALKAASSPTCDFVTTSELSGRSTIGNLQFWADCKNGTRIRFSEDEL